MHMSENDCRYIQDSEEGRLFSDVLMEVSLDFCFVYLSIKDKSDVNMIFF